MGGRAHTAATAPQRAHHTALGGLRISPRRVSLTAHTRNGDAQSGRTIQSDDKPPICPFHAYIRSAPALCSVKSAQRAPSSSAAYTRGADSARGRCAKLDTQRRARAASNVGRAQMHRCAFSRPRASLRIPPSACHTIRPRPRLHTSTCALRDAQDAIPS
ncbi:hypothetical protein HYPSUDRAFT_203358 [Hypholoma sublateritium FD-334 SS-4]|uniref:Uncharacterized protein n=1 Tax=Hypholoma sublateritium (strain FD-334 SS-4) TaxID=945553 RepID=A0A0D2NWU0_HYPSF|nr:hypothetical protein HYPSUDRAFT_203358 [Hypholoma sublateritium FD-334 SS-4]